MIEKRVTVADFLTEQEIKTATKLYAEVGIKDFARRFAELVIEPNIERINKKLGQENDPRYLAYAVEYALMMADKKGKSIH